jgi:hypothetical protein
MIHEKSENILNSTVVAYFKVLSRNLTDIKEMTHKSLRQNSQVSCLGFKLGTSETQVRSIPSRGNFLG